MRSLISTSKKSQFDHHSDFAKDLNSSGSIASSWLRSNTTDAWRHDRMRLPILPLVKAGQEWLTIGDGRFASDARWLSSLQANVTASDIQDQTLKEAFALGLIENYTVVDAEEIPFADDSFDYVFCKESLHHLPRPYLGLYEMLRCARKGVILIEPAGKQAKGFWGQLTLAVYRCFKPRPIFFEASGNYVFEIRLDDIRQMLLALGLTSFSYKFYNDDYLDGVEFDRLDTLLKAIKRRIMYKNIRDILLGWHYGSIILVVHKSDEPSAIHALSLQGFESETLPISPLLRGRV